jgi:hypothetical protein
MQVTGKNGKQLTKTQMNRIIRGQLRRARLTPAERTIRHALLRLQQGSISLAAKAVHNA